MSCFVCLENTDVRVYINGRKTTIKIPSISIIYYPVTIKVAGFFYILFVVKE